MDDEDDLEFEGDSDDEDVDGEEPAAPARSEDSRYCRQVQDWSRQHPEARVRFIREDSDDNCAVLELRGTELQVYVPQEDDSDFFVTTENEDARVNSVLTELNDMPHLRTLPDLLTEAARLLGSGADSAAGALTLERMQSSVSAGGLDITSPNSSPELTRSKSAIVLDFHGLRAMQDELIDKVSISAQVEKHVAALLLLHCNWDDGLLRQRLATDAPALRSESGLALSPGEEPRPPPQLCSVCFVDEAVACLPCGHGLCSDDWPAFLKCNLDSGTVDGENCLRLRCPGERCGMLVPGRHFERFLEPGDYARYQWLRVLSFVNDNKQIVWCPANGCELCVGFSRRKSTVKCRCGHRFCFSCRLPAHAPAKCSSARAWIEKKEKMKGAPRQLSDSKPCPNPDCKVMSHKESGCHYLCCPKCKEHWCWQCGDWGGGPSGRPEPHHVFDCNNPINQDWARSTSSLFDNEGRYWFYYDRHANHLGSLAFAEDLHAALPEAAWNGEELNPPEISREYSSVRNFDPIGNGCAQSMLDSPQAWTAARDNVGEWMQIDLGKVCSVIGLILQGRDNGEGLEEWVTRLRVEHGSTSFRSDTSVGEFQACADSTSKTKVFFDAPISTRYLRLAPLAWEGHISMRAAAMVLDEVTEKEWACPNCTVVNCRDALVCHVCEGPRTEPTSDIKRKQDARQLALDASELLVECRLVLAWTYVWAFFETDEVKRELFEFVQKDLETKTEQLSGMIENQPLETVLRERLRLLDYVSALRGYMENVKEYTTIDPEAEAPKL